MDRMKFQGIRERKAQLELWLSKPSPMSQKYGQLIVESYNDIPKLMNMLARAFNSMLLGGFLFLPLALPRLRHSAALASMVGEGTVYHIIQNVPLFVAAAITLVLGAAGDCWLWFCPRHHGNLVWIKDNLLL